MAKGKFFTKKQLFHVVYSIGASIVILGAMFKILHMGFGPFTGDSLLMLVLSLKLWYSSFLHLKDKKKI